MQKINNLRLEPLICGYRNFLAPNLRLGPTSGNTLERIMDTIEINSILLCFHVNIYIQGVTEIQVQN